MLSHEVSRSRDSCGRRVTKCSSRDSCGCVAEHKVGPRISGTHGLGGKNSTVQPARSRGCEVARGTNINPSPWLHVEGAIPVSPDRVSQDLKGEFGGFKSRTRETARFS
jgi:hypothetical protein